MKTLLTYFAIALMMASCHPVMVYDTERSNYNIKQAKKIIASQKKVRKKQLKAMKKNRKKELEEMKAMSRVNKN